MPLHLTPGYKCPFCKCVVSKEIAKEYFPIFCPYCDIPMRRRNFDKKYKKSNDDVLVTTKIDDIVTSECSSDCLKEDIHFSDIEENTTEYIVLTDSEDEEEGSVKELYKKIMKISLSNLPDETDQAFLSSNTGKNLPDSDQGNKQTEEEEDVDEEEEEPVEEEEDGDDDPADEDYDVNDDV